MKTLALILMLIRYVSLIKFGNLTFSRSNPFGEQIVARMYGVRGFWKPLEGAVHAFEKYYKGDFLLTS